MINPSEGVIDLNDINNYQTFFDIAKESELFGSIALTITMMLTSLGLLAVGIFVIARPGPFINGETSGVRLSIAVFRHKTSSLTCHPLEGGIPGWVIRKEGAIRTNSTSYAESECLTWK